MAWERSTDLQVREQSSLWLKLSGTRKSRTKFGVSNLELIQGRKLSAKPSTSKTCLICHTWSTAPRCSLHALTDGSCQLIRLKRSACPVSWRYWIVSILTV